MDSPSPLKPALVLATIAGIFWAGRWSKTCKTQDRSARLSKKRKDATPTASRQPSRAPTLPTDPATPSA